jgi:hypothetical protein
MVGVEFALLEAVARLGVGVGVGEELDVRPGTELVFKVEGLVAAAVGSTARRGRR